MVKRKAEVCPAAPNFSKEHLPTPDPWPCLPLRKATPVYPQKTLGFLLQQACLWIHPQHFPCRIFPDPVAHTFSSGLSEEWPEDLWLPRSLCGLVTNALHRSRKEKKKKEK